MQLYQLTQEALKLSDSDRALLALHLLDSREYKRNDWTELLWIEEVERRWTDYNAGRITLRPMEDVLDDACGGRTT